MDSREISSSSKVGASSSGSESAMERHRQLMALYTSSGQSDKDVLASNHQFVRDDADDSQNHGKDDWGIRMARKYYAKLYKEYAIVDLSMHTSGKIGLRWRTENEVVSGRGQFTCASKHCDSNLNLHSYEVPFEYNEKQIKKNELVKVRVCIECAKKLFYEKLKTMRKERRKRRRKSEDDSGDEEEEGSAVITNSHDSIIQELFHFKELIECKKEKTETKSQKRGSDHLNNSSAS